MDLFSFQRCSIPFRIFEFEHIFSGLMNHYWKQFSVAFGFIPNIVRGCDWTVVAHEYDVLGTPGSPTDTSYLSFSVSHYLSHSLSLKHHTTIDIAHIYSETPNVLFCTSLLLNGNTEWWRITSPNTMTTTITGWLRKIVREEFVESSEVIINYLIAHIL